MDRKRKRRYLHPVFTVTKILPDCGDDQTSSSSSSGGGGSSHTSIWPSNRKSRHSSNTTCGNKGSGNSETESSLKGRCRASSNDRNDKRPATSKGGSDSRGAKTNYSSSSNDVGGCRASSNDDGSSRATSSDSRISPASGNDGGSGRSSSSDGGSTLSSSKTPLMPDGSAISQKPADRRNDVAVERSTAARAMHVRNTIGREKREPNNLSIASGSTHAKQDASTSEIKSMDVKSHLAKIPDQQLTETPETAVDLREPRGRKLYKCAFCTLSFKWKPVFRAHRLWHMKEKAYICEECGKSFRRQCDLKSHHNVHDNSKPFKCAACDKSYKRKKDLMRHHRSNADHIR